LLFAAASPVVGGPIRGDEMAKTFESDSCPAGRAHPENQILLSTDANCRFTKYPSQALISTAPGAACFVIIFAQRGQFRQFDTLHGQ
jgi:hypothetical protein